MKKEKNIAMPWPIVWFAVGNALFGAGAYSVLINFTGIAGIFAHKSIYWIGAAGIIISNIAWQKIRVLMK